MGRRGTTFTRQLVKLGGQSRLDLLSQDRYWADQHGNIRRLERMDPDHRRNLHQYLLDNAGRLQRCVEEMLQEQWQGAADAPTVLGVSAQQWMANMPLLKRLEQLIAEDDAAVAATSP